MVICLSNCRVPLVTSAAQRAGSMKLIFTAYIMGNEQDGENGRILWLLARQGGTVAPIPLLFSRELTSQLVKELFRFFFFFIKDKG